MRLSELGCKRWKVDVQSIKGCGKREEIQHCYGGGVELDKFYAKRQQVLGRFLGAV